MSRTLRAFSLCALGGSLALSWFGCVGGAPMQRLYDGGEQSPSEVAELQGNVEHVDGVRVSGGKFTLLPGCHVIRPPTSWGESSSMNAMYASLPVMHASIEMKGGSRYFLSVISGRFDGTGSGRIQVEATELDEQGTPLAKFLMFAGEGSASACQTEALGSRQAIGADK